MCFFLLLLKWIVPGTGVQRGVNGGQGLLRGSETAHKEGRARVDPGGSNTEGEVGGRVLSEQRRKVCLSPACPPARPSVCLAGWLSVCLPAVSVPVCLVCLSDIF